MAHAIAAASGQATPDLLLGELKEAHAKVLRAIDDLECLTRGRVPAKELLVKTRWRLSSASLTRRLLWGRIHAYLSRHPDRRFEENLRRLQQVDMELLRISSKHVADWSVDSILADWAGYCRASERIQRAMIEAIDQERQLLFPLLSELHGRGRECLRLVK